MKIRMGNQDFVDVTIPVLWGQRAVVQDRRGALSVIDLGGSTARLEILADKPAPGAEFVPEDEGFVVRQSGEDLYSYVPATKTLTPIALKLLPVQIQASGTLVGTNFFSGNVISGYGVGIYVREGGGIGVGAPLPPGLAKLMV